MFIFGEPLNTTDDLHYTAEEILSSNKIMNYWANFAKYRYGETTRIVACRLVSLGVPSVE